jgi:hypothetical protein
MRSFLEKFYLKFDALRSIEKCRIKNQKEVNKMPRGNGTVPRSQGPGTGSGMSSPRWGHGHGGGFGAGPGGSGNKKLIDNLLRVRERRII